MKIEIVNSVNEDAWRFFVDQHPCGNIFHTPEMFRVFEQAIGHRPLLWAALDQYGEILAMLHPVQISLANGVLRRLTTRAVVYGGVLCTPRSANQDVLNVLLQAYCQDAAQESLFTEIRNLSDLSIIQPLLSQCEFYYEDHLNYLIRLNGSTGEILQKIGSRTRKNIRRAMHRGTVIAEDFCDPDLLPTWYELLQKSYSAARVPLADISLFEAAFQILQPRGMAQFWLAHTDSAYVAASLELLYKDIIYGWYSGVDRDYSREFPGELLMWRVLERGCMNGYKVYDFGGAGRPDEEYGVRDFKAKFGGDLVCFGRNKKVHSPNLLRWSEKGYSVYRHLLGFV